MNAFVSINRGFGGAEKQFDQLYLDFCKRPAVMGSWSYVRCDRASLGWWATLCKLLRIRDEVVVYNMSVLGIGVLPMLLLKALGNRIVLYPHVVVPAARSRPRLWRIRTWLQRLSLRLADHVVLISDGNWFELEPFLSAAKATIVYNYVGCENDRLFQSPPLNRKIAVIGRIQDGHKQQLSFLREHGALIKDAGLELHFFGSGPDEPALREEVRIQDLDAYCVLHGWLDEEAIYAHDFSFVLNLSRWEGLPLSVIEALYRDRIALASDINGNRELVYSDFLFKNDGELRQLLLTMVRDHRVDVELLRAQKQRLFKRCNKEQALATLELMLGQLCQHGRTR